jgi:hypothetical protein
VSVEEMVEKITAALMARRRALVIARTDARGVLGSTRRSRGAICTEGPELT